MNAFVEHHENSIRFGYRCFDRLLLNASPDILSDFAIAGVIHRSSTGPAP